jgi:hypothetical protein
MTDFRFLHAADVHLGGGFAGLSLRESDAGGALADATRRAFENLIDAALAEPVDFVVIAGDLYDGPWKDVGAALFVRGQFRRLAEAGIAAFLVKGNHDAESEIADALPLPDNVHVFASRAPETRRIESLRVALHGQSFPRRHVPEDISRVYPAPLPGWFNIALLHTSADGRPGHAVYAPCAVEALRNAGHDYWALGHVHARETLSAAPVIAYPGCLQGRHIRETGPKGALIVRVRDGRPTPEFLPLDAARWAEARMRVDAIAGDHERRAALSRALGDALDQAEGRPCFVRLRYTGAGPHDAVLRRLGRAALHEEGAALAAGLSGDLIVESVRIDSAPPREVDPVRLAPFAPALAAAASDPELHALIEADIAALVDRTPPEARPDDLDPGALIAEARRLLLARAEDAEDGG